MLSEEERALARHVQTWIIWRTGDEPAPIVVCLSEQYAALEMAKRSWAGDRYAKSGPSNVAYDLERRYYDERVAKALLEKLDAGERGSLDLEP